MCVCVAPTYSEQAVTHGNEEPVWVFSGTAVESSLAASKVCGEGRVVVRGERRGQLGLKGTVTLSLSSRGARLNTSYSHYKDELWCTYK